MSTVQTGDTIAVYRSGKLYKAPADMSTLRNSDLIVVGRGNQSYQCTFADWKASQASINKPRMLTPANGAGQTTQAISDEIIQYEHLIGRATLNTSLSPAFDSAFNVQGLRDATLDPFLGVVDYRPASGAHAGVSCTDVCAEIYNKGAWQATVNYFTATNLLSGQPYQRAYMTQAPEVYINFAVGSYVFYAGDNLGNNARKLIIDPADPKNTGVATFKVETSTALATASRTVIDVTTAGAVRVKPDGLYTIYIYGITSGLNIIHLKTSKDLAVFAVGDLISQSDNTASGEIGKIDVPGKQIYLRSTTGTWSANTGKTVIGAPKLTTGAAVGETPTFTSSAFSATGSVTHASSDWQVTLKTDTAFASPVVQSMADTAHLLSWDGGPLQANTDYIARVRHNGSGGVVSPWSDAVGFKTKASFYPTAQPGYLYEFVNPTTPAIAITGPAKVVNVFRNADMFAVGVDGKLYHAAEATTSLSVFAGVPNPASDIVDFWRSYGEAVWVAVHSDGSVTTSTGAVLPAGEKAVSMKKLGGVSRVVLVRTASHKLYAYGHQAGGNYVGTLNVGNDAWKEVPITLPAGETLKDITGIAGEYSAQALLLLTESGKLYVSGELTAPGSGGPVMAQLGLPTTGTNAAPVLVPGLAGKKFVKVGTATSCYNTYLSISALTDSGDLYLAYGPDLASCFVAAAGTPRAFSLFGSGYASCICGSYNYEGWYALKQDGTIWGATNSLSPVACNLGVTPSTTITGLGTAVGSANTSGRKPLMIIP